MTRNLVRVNDAVAALLDGTMSVKDLDDEELAHGYPRAADGSFRGAPTVVPRSLHQRMVRELFDRANQKMKDKLIDVAEAMAEMATNPEYDPAVRLKAGQWVMERMMGKTPDVVVNVEEKRYEKMFDRIDRDAIIVDAEVVDDGREP